MDKDQIILLEDRGLILITGEDVKNFLQNIITNDIEKVNLSTSIFSALFTPQGKYLFECGVDVIGFGPVATTEKLHYYLPMHKQDNTGLSLGFGTVSQTAYNRQSIEICKNIPLVGCKKQETVL